MDKPAIVILPGAWHDPSCMATIIGALESSGYKVYTRQMPYWFSTLKSHALASMWAKTTAASWQNIPTSYLLCEDDLAIPAVAQEGICKGVSDAGAEIEITRLKSGHSPFLSKPKETVKWLRRVAGEKI